MVDKDFFFFFFFNDTATTEIYTLSLHDALPIYVSDHGLARPGDRVWRPRAGERRSEEHTSELQSHHDLVCRLLLEKKKQNKSTHAELRHRAHRRNQEHATTASSCTLHHPTTSRD